MNRRSQVGFLASLVLRLSAGAGPADPVALESVEALYKHDGARFVRVVHSTRIRELRGELLRGIEASINMPNTKKELKEIFGVSMLEELRALHSTVFVRLAINKLPNREDGIEQRDFAKARFTVSESKQKDDDTQVVSIAIDFENRHRTIRVEVVCKLEGAVWKYWKSSE